MTALTPAEASAPAKIILFGEHAVVYGQPALAAPLSSMRAFAAARPAPARAGWTIEAVDLGRRLTRKPGGSAEHPLLRAAALCLKACGVEPEIAFNLRLSSQIPIASGLGSGAALTAALMRALSAAVNAPLPNDRLNALVYDIERDFHGTPSGIDNTVVVYEQPLFFVRGQEPALLRAAAPFTLLIADTGVRSSTREAVSGVRAFVEANEAVGQSLLAEIGAIAREARSAIEGGQPELLGPLMNANHRLLQQIGVSSPELDTLVQTAHEAGAPGAKLSGGGRGGNMIVLCPEGQEAHLSTALHAAGAQRVFQTRIEAHG